MRWWEQQETDSVGKWGKGAGGRLAELNPAETCNEGRRDGGRRGGRSGGGVSGGGAMGRGRSGGKW